MNLIGKILIVLVFVMSLVFMSFAVAVYATHKNWKEVVESPNDGLAALLKNAKSYNDELKDQKDALDREVAAEQKAAEQARAKVESELQQKKVQLDQAKLKEASLVKDTREAVGAMNQAHATLADLRGEVVKLRSEILGSQNEKDASVKRVIQLTDELNQLLNDLKRLKERGVDLAADLADAEIVLGKFGLQANPMLYEDQPWKGVEGVVLAVPSRDYIEISIGEDDGLLVGHTLEVVRISGGANKYVGRVEVVQTHPDKSVCKIDPKFLQSPMQRGDRVISKTKLPKLP